MASGGFKKIAIIDLFNRFVKKPSGTTKQQITKELTKISLKNGYKVLIKTSSNKRYYYFEPLIVEQTPIKELYSIVTNDILLDMHSGEYVCVKADDYERVKELVRKSKYITNSKFKLSLSEDGIYRLFRVA